MRLAGPLRIVALVVTVGVTWIALSILLGGPGSHFPRIQQLFTSPESSVTAEPRARKYKCGLPQPCPEEHLAFRMVSGAANVIGPKICLEDKMLMSSVKDNVGRGLNIALVNGVSGELIEARAFDMWAGDVNDLLKFIRPLHEGTLVFVASYDDPATKMNEETRKLFSDLGSKNVKDLAFRDSWVFVGAKGVQNKSPFEQRRPPNSLMSDTPGAHSGFSGKAEVTDNNGEQPSDCVRPGTSFHSNFSRCGMRQAQDPLTPSERDSANVPGQ